MLDFGKISMITADFGYSILRILNADHQYFITKKKNHFDFRFLGGIASTHAKNNSHVNNVMEDVNIYLSNCFLYFVYFPSMRTAKIDRNIIILKVIFDSKNHEVF